MAPRWQAHKTRGGPQNQYKHGDFNRICDRSGFKVKASETRREWNGYIVRVEDWEIRQPQDFVRGVPDHQAAPYPRPDVEPEFVAQPEFFITTDGDNFFTVDGSRLQVIPDG